MGIHPTKVVIIGTGFVGSSIAYAILIRDLCTELILIDRNKEKAIGEAMDLSHGLPFISPVEIRAGGYEECEGAEIIIITAGLNQKPEQTRLELAQENANILKTILTEVKRYESNAIVIIVSNPVDVLTTLAIKNSGLPPERIIGSGTVLDTARFRYIMSQRCGINPSNIHAYVVGEHGDSEVPLFSSASIGGNPLDFACKLCTRYCECKGNWREEVVTQVRKAAYEIINRKGATYYGIGLSCAQIVGTILRDERKVLTISSFLNDHYQHLGVALSVPCIIGSKGVVNRLSTQMDTEEQALFEKSANMIRESVAGITWSS